MKKGLYCMLAWTGIKRNRRLYLPYILTCIGMVMMCYIISFLTAFPGFETMRGWGTMKTTLSLGFNVMCIFSLIFLFYTNSFLVRRRKKEFGLYNILGLGKKNLALVLLVETLMIYAIVISGGFAFGVLFSKLAELCVTYILGGSAGFTFAVDFASLYKTAGLFAVIFALIFLNTLRQIQLANPIELIKSEDVGEKPPRANWILAAAGAVVLGAAYYIAIRIEDPLSAITYFFLAVIMVIAATYVLFVAGSVAVCRLMQKNKEYYYKTSHFISVSSMAYRMKRNGAGLASICILCTMVLVMISSTVCLYAGAEDGLKNMYTRDINITGAAAGIEGLNADNRQKITDMVGRIAAENGAEEENTVDYRTAATAACISDGKLMLEDLVYAQDIKNISKAWQLFVIPVSDYNSMLGTNETLADDEAMIYATKGVSFDQNKIDIGGNEFTVVKTAEGFEDKGADTMQAIPSLYVFVNDFEAVVDALEQKAAETGISTSIGWYYKFDLGCSDDVQIQIYNQIVEAIQQTAEGEGEALHILVSSRANERMDFYGTYGGLLFLGVILGLVFVSATVLIIYYKQISEGYEDQKRFDIMQKVGMTKEEIKKSINSQVLTVFFAPLVMAGVHLAFAFPMVRKMLLLFGMANTELLTAVTAVCFLVFALFYAAVYRTTSRSYFSIVSGMRYEN